MNGLTPRVRARDDRVHDLRSPVADLRPWQIAQSHLQGSAIISATLTINARDRRSRLAKMTAKGRHVWRALALPKIHAYCEQLLADFSINDTARMVHYLLSILENMQRLDAPAADDGDAP